MTRISAPDIKETFWSTKDGDFGARGFVHSNGILESPIVVVADIIRTRVAEEAEIDLAGVKPVDLQEFEDRYGRYGEDLNVSARHASFSARLGGQILALNEIGDIQPPLTPREGLMIQHLVAVVKGAATQRQG